MLIYQRTKKDFMNDVAAGTLADILDETIREKMHRVTGKSEIHSWENSMQYMFHVLNHYEIPEDAGIAIEYNIPQTSKRVDFMISGYSETRKPNVVIVELKQWEEVKAIKGVDAVVETFTGGKNRSVVHPSYQVWSYAKLIEDYNTSVQDHSIGMIPCAYLHNYKKRPNDPLLETQYQEYITEAPVFLRGQSAALTQFILDFISQGDNQNVLYDIDNGKIRPSKSLQDAIGSVMKGNQEFIMIDDQKVAYEEIFKQAVDAKKTGRKHVVIVKGGPGTGKSVIAINLLADLTIKDNQAVQYVSKISAPRSVYKQKLTANGSRAMNKNRFDNLFKGSGSYIDVPENSIDTILCDEAHRLNEKSGLFSNQGENQVKEIIHAARCSVFFLDENQRVTIKDIGSSKLIHQFAREAGADVTVLELQSQFRCNGSNGYLAWIDNVLQIRNTANFTMEGIDYDIRILDSPQEVFDLIQARDAENGNSRMVAGYCWEWNKASKDNPDMNDIKIGDFEMSWNLGNTIFATDKGSINQIGCIHTTQGLEFDYVGVIVGEDLCCENGKLITDFTRRAKTDSSLKGIKKIAKQDPEKAQKIADEIIKNTYRTLMTRGMKGCYIYCCDEQLALYLKQALGWSHYQSS